MQQFSWDTHILFLKLSALVKSHDVERQFGDLTTTELKPVSNTAYVAVEVVLGRVAFEEVCLSYQVVDCIQLFFFVFEVCHMSSVRSVAHIGWHSNEVGITLLLP